METLAYIGYILLAIFTLLLMIMIHEFGHYIAGKILKFKINEFSIGFGPKLISKRLKNGELFCLRAIPLGGFCAFEGEDVIEQDPAVFEEENKGGIIKMAGRVTGTAVATAPATGSAATGGLATSGGLAAKKESFNDQAPWKRIIVLLAGASFNLLSAVLFSFIFILAVGLPQPKIAASALDENLKPYVTLEKGDVITHINGERTDTNYLFSGSLDNSSPEGVFDYALGRYYSLGTDITLTVRKESGKVEKVVLSRQLVARRDIQKPLLGEDGEPVKDKYGNTVGQLVLDDNGDVIYDSLYGLSMNTHHDKTFGTAIKRCVPLTGKMSWLVLSTLGKLVTGQLSCNSVSGPVGTIVGIADNTQDYGWASLFLMLPLIAANLGVFNLLPIPALDGSKIIFCIIEWIRKKPISRKVEGMIHAIGLFALFGLVILLDISGMLMRCGV